MGASQMGFLFFCSILFLSASASSRNLPIIAFDEGYTPLFGDNNVFVHKDGKSVHLSLDERTSSGFVSHDLYLHGFFSASIKLPADYTAGVVVAFYMSNGDMYEKNHDEIDFEFLGNIRGKDWRIQTNVYGNGSTSIGREERFGLWFDPAEVFHQYSILWTDSRIIFYVDNILIREVAQTKSMGGDFPSKPMTLYATIWDASDWATNGGKYRVNYKYAPYVAKFSDLVLHGCAVDPIEHVANCDTAQSSESIPSGVTPVQRLKMESFRKKHTPPPVYFLTNNTTFTIPNSLLPPVVLASTLLALICPPSLTWFTTRHYAPALGFLMFAVGVNSSEKDFLEAFSRPAEIATSYFGQFCCEASSLISVLYYCTNCFWSTSRNSSLGGFNSPPSPQMCVHKLL